MPARRPLADPTVPTGVVRPTVQPSAGFTTPGARAPELEQPVDVVGALTSMSRSLQVIFAKRIKDNQEAEEKRIDARVRATARNVEGVLQGIQKAALTEFGAKFETLGTKKQAKIQKRVLADMGIPNEGAQLEVWAHMARAHAEDALTTVAPQIPGFASAENPNGLAEFTAAIESASSAGATQALLGVQQYRDEYSFWIAESGRALGRQFEETRAKNVANAKRDGEVVNIYKGTPSLPGFTHAARTPELAKDVLGKNLPQILEERVLAFGDSYVDEVVEALTRMDADASLDLEEKLTFLDNFEAFAVDNQGTKLAQSGGPTEIMTEVARLRSKWEDDQITKDSRRAQRVGSAVSLLTLYAQNAAAEVLEANPAASAEDLAAAVERRMNLLRGEGARTEDLALFDVIDTPELAGAARDGIRDAKQALGAEVEVDLKMREQRLTEFGRILASGDRDGAIRYAQSNLTGKEALAAEAALGQNPAMEALERSDAAIRVSNILTDTLEIAGTLSAEDLQGVAAIAEEWEQIKSRFVLQEFDDVTLANQALTEAVTGTTADARRLNLEMRRVRAEYEAEMNAILALAPNDFAGAKQRLAGRSLGPERDRQIRAKFDEIERTHSRAVSLAIQHTQNAQGRHLGGVTAFRALDEDPDAQSTKALLVERKVTALVKEWAVTHLQDPNNDESSLLLEIDDQVDAAYDQVVQEVFKEPAAPDEEYEAMIAFRNRRDGVNFFNVGERAAAVGGAITEEILPDTLGRRRVPHFQNIGSSLEAALSGDGDVADMVSPTGRLYALSSSPDQRSASLQMLSLIPGALGPNLENIRFEMDTGNVADTNDFVDSIAAAGTYSKADVALIRGAVEKVTLPFQIPQEVTLSDGTTITVTGTKGVFTEGRQIHFAVPVPDDFSTGPMVSFHSDMDPTKVDPAVLRQMLRVPEDNAEAARLLDVPEKEVDGAVLQMAFAAIRFGEKAGEL